jgi:hypothetical protein
MRSYNETGVVTHEENNSKFTVINCSWIYYVTHVLIVYGVVNIVISIEICVVFESLIWFQKTTPYIASSSEVSACFNFAQDKMQYTRKMKQWTILNKDKIFEFFSICKNCITLIILRYFIS